MHISKSINLFTRAKKSLTGGVSSNSRLRELPAPPYFESGKGARIYDVDQNEYIDYVLGRGPLLFGHSPKFILNEVEKYINYGQAFETANYLEIELSEKIKSIIPYVDLVHYATTGTEIVEIALKLSRAFTKKSKVIMFEGQYHGWTDNTLVPEINTPNTALLKTNGVPNQLYNNIVTLPWNDITSLENMMSENHNEIASIITSPAPDCELNKEFLKNIRNLCDKWKIVLIFDEVITGFRMSIGGAQKLCGIKPDLTTFAKALGGGFPISMICGNHNIMSLLEDNRVYYGGKFNSSLMSLAAANTILSHIITNEERIYKQLYEIGNQLITGIKKHSEKHNIPIVIKGFGPMFKMSFKHDLNNTASIYKKFYTLMVKNGIRIEYGEYSGSIWFISTEHQAEDIQITLNTIDKIFKKISIN